MALSPADRVQKAALDAALLVFPHPKLKWRSLDLKFRDEGNLKDISDQFGIKLETLQHQKDSGRDNPAYRFHRDDKFFEYFSRNAEELKGSTWLDVGAGRGQVSLYLSEMLKSDTFELNDVVIERNSNFDVKKFDGTRLDYPEKSFDVVFFSYVLHHAADNTIPLLKDAGAIARKYVVVLEDPRETDADYIWAQTHDRKGTFRGRKEWRSLFSILGFRMVYEAELDSDIHSRHFFVLAPGLGKP